MNRYLAIGYVLTAMPFLANVMVLQGSVPNLEGMTALLVSQLILLALIPAAVFLFIGARRSVGRVRKFIGYSLFAFDTLGGFSACFAIALIVSGHAHVVAA